MENWSSKSTLVRAEGTGTSRWFSPKKEAGERGGYGQGQAPARRRLGTIEMDGWAAGERRASMPTRSMALCGTHCLGSSLRFQLFKFPWVPETTGSYHLWDPGSVHPASGLSLSRLDRRAWWARLIPDHSLLVLHPCHDRAFISVFGCGTWWWYVGRPCLLYFPSVYGDGVGWGRLLLRACQGAKVPRPMGSTCGIRQKMGQTVLHHSVIASCFKHYHQSLVNTHIRPLCFQTCLRSQGRQQWRSP